ncbi:MAG: peptidase M28 [Gammaproteobacteria bacterium]|nr:peptidase M28 [Gammaproteobacteria bacterium]
MFYNSKMMKKLTYLFLMLLIAGCTPDSEFEKYKKHVVTLASDKFEGRAPGTAGGEKTKSYIANHFESLGLNSFGGSYLMPVNLTGINLNVDESYFNLSVNGEMVDINYRTDVVYGTTRQIEEVAFDDSDLVFVGYGVNAPEYDWNDYKVDVTGKTVVMLINDPGFELKGTEFNGKAMTYYGRWTYKFEEAARQGAAGVLIIHETAPASYPWGVVENGWSGEQLNLTFADRNLDRSALEGWITLDMAEQLFAELGSSYDEMKSLALSKDFQPVAMEGMKLSSKMVSSIRTSDSHNVVGYVEGSEAPEEFVLIMGHWDHMGVDESLEGDQIYNGAVDNATGTAAVMHMAETFSKRKPKRSVAFIGLTAEESGLLGSAYLVENAPFEYRNVIGGLNLDAFPAIGKSKDITIIGYGASELEAVLDKHASVQGKYLAPDKSPEAGFFYRSDHINFAKKGIPMIYADPGIDLVDGGIEKGLELARNYTANDYHKPTDEVRDDWDWEGIEQDMDIFTNFIDDLANSGEYPNWYIKSEFRALRDASRNE